ncbi:MAG: PQQ-dependent sugar dehydrogenase [Nitrospirota bacterium]|nr:PQQ-dependent sugar dehydrogenase [Nitrospirota bacterium]
MMQDLSLRLCATVGIALMLAVVMPAPAKAGAESAPTQSSSIHLLPLVTAGLERPLFLTHAGDGSRRLFVVEQPGAIRIISQGVRREALFLDLRDRVLTDDTERGLLGLAFHPDYRRNGRFFVNYTRQPDGATVVAEYRRGGAPDAASRDERVLMVVMQPESNHNGGMLAFGPDGYLYIGLGDGGAWGDPGNRAQNLNELLGKVLRIDVDHGDPYAIPEDNPFAREGGRPEIYAVGLRNPWRFSFDFNSAELWVADVGQKKWEEVDLVTRGGNYGWRVMEGSHCYNPATSCPTEGLALPVMEYRHEEGRCSIIGGYVYRGLAMPALRGAYLFGDYCSGEVFVFRQSDEGGKDASPTVLIKTGFRISSFGQDEEGEIYLLDHGGGIYRLIPR